MLCFISLVRRQSLLLQFIGGKKMGNKMEERFERGYTYLFQSNGGIVLEGEICGKDDGIIIIKNSEGIWHINLSNVFSFTCTDKGTRKMIEDVFK